MIRLTCLQLDVTNSKDIEVAAAAIQNSVGEEGKKEFLWPFEIVCVCVYSLSLSFSLFLSLSLSLSLSLYIIYIYIYIYIYIFFF